MNDLAPPEALARLLWRDSVFGRFAAGVSADGDYLVVGAHRVRMLQEPEVVSLPGAALGLDVLALPRSTSSRLERGQGALPVRSRVASSTRMSRSCQATSSGPRPLACSTRD